jgi:hypothetical protein
VETLKVISITVLLMFVVAFIIASWYIIVIAAAITFLYIISRIYVSVNRKEHDGRKQT